MSAGIYIFCGQVFEKNCPKYESTDELLSNCKKDQVVIHCYDDEGLDEENSNYDANDEYGCRSAQS